ncbi:MAG: DUF2073 domain-containing protein [Candidatus Nanohaloarchaea archaeon]
MSEDGVTIEFFSKDRLSEEGFEDKLDMVLDRVRENAVLVLEEGWTPEEKRQLIRKSMDEIDDDFPGIEFLGLDSGSSRLDRVRDFFYERVLNEEHRRGITIVGNSRVMEKIREERDTVSFLATLEEE